MLRISKEAIFRNLCSSSLRANIRVKMDWDHSDSKDDYDDDDPNDYGYDDPDDGDDYDDDDDMDSLTPRIPASELQTMKRCQSMYAKLNKNRKECLLCDATISVDGKKYPVHKIILSSASSYFCTMFTGSFMEKNEDCIEIQGVSEAVFGNLLDYIYGEELKLNFENIKELYMGADMLCIDGLIEDCKMFFKENWENFTDINAIFEMAHEFGFKEIVPKIVNRVRIFLHNSSLRTEYKELSYELICKIFEEKSPDIVHLNREWNMVKYLVWWVMLKPEERLPEMALELLSRISLKLISETNFNEILEKSFNSNEYPKADASIVQAFKLEMKSQFEKPHALIGDNLELVALDVSEGVEFCNVSVFDSSTWKWESKSYPIGFKPESALVKDDDLYVFGTGGGCILNTRMNTLVKLPRFPLQRSKFTVAVVNNTVSVWGGVQIDMKRPQADVLELRPNSSFWSCDITWTENKCGASMIAINKCLYIVGGVQPDSSSINEGAEIFVYNFISNEIQKIGELLYPREQSKLAVLDNVLYIFKKEFEIVNRIDIKTHKKLETVNVIHALGYCVLSDVFPVRDVIIVVLIYEDQVMLGLVKPSENMKFEILALVSEPNSSKEMGYRKDYLIYLRKKFTP